MPATLPAQLPQKPLHTWSGVNLRPDGLAVGEHELLRAMNADLHTELGVIRPRYGRTLLAPTTLPAPVYGLFRHAGPTRSPGTSGTGQTGRPPAGPQGARPRHAAAARHPWSPRLAGIGRRRAPHARAPPASAGLRVCPAAARAGCTEPSANLQKVSTLVSPRVFCRDTDRPSAEICGRLPAPGWRVRADQCAGGRRVVRSCHERRVLASHGPRRGLCDSERSVHGWKAALYRTASDRRLADDEGHDLSCRQTATVRSRYHHELLQALSCRGSGEGGGARRDPRRRGTQTVGGGQQRRRLGDCLLPENPRQRPGLCRAARTHRRGRCPAPDYPHGLYAGADDAAPLGATDRRWGRRVPRVGPVALQAAQVA